MFTPRSLYQISTLVITNSTTINDAAVLSSLFLCKIAICLLTKTRRSFVRGRILVLPSSRSCRQRLKVPRQRKLASPHRSSARPSFPRAADGCATSPPPSPWHQRVSLRGIRLWGWLPLQWHALSCREATTLGGVSYYCHCYQIRQFDG